VRRAVKRNPLKLSLLVAAAVAATGCAARQTPQELVDARAAYGRASVGPAAQLAPAQLHVAQESLNAAEQAFLDDGDSESTRDKAYIAIRKVELAESQARQIDLGQRINMAENQVQITQAQAAARTQSELTTTKAELATDEQRLANERRRREDAEKRAAQAMSDLARIASVKQEARGMVITLSGSVLFASDKTELLPTAQAKLSEVADALTKGDPDSKIVVEGHTDSQGPASYNQDLSQHRAESVRGYLVSHGVAPDRITAQGFGSTRPVADNNSAEGRANNRRVEIIVQPGSKP
jgi:outer membrane protein OmpA-like peptidoglycan-associated protein